MSIRDDNQNFDESDDLPDPRLTELVAYLDGELSEDQSQLFEKRLASDQSLRGYAESLDRTWRMLDSLGEATASGEFTQRTLASLKTISSHAEDSSGVPLSTRLKTPGKIAINVSLWTVVGFAGCAAGLLLSRSAVDTEPLSDDLRILQQLELIQDVPQLYSVPDADFLRKVMELQSRPDGPVGGNP